MDTKLQKFIEAAITSPKHPVYKLGYSKHPILQSYALYVSVLETHTPERWAKDYPEYVATMEAVMKLCEEQDATEQAKTDEVAALKSEIDALKAAVAGLTAKPAEVPAPSAETPAPESSADA